jgi:beta-glucanase (GH16 family)
MIEGKMRALWLPFFIVLVCSTIAAQTGPGWRLVWSDEFNGKAGTPPDPGKWNYDIGRGNPAGWGNNELETYTNLIQNAFQDGNGNLVIRAIRDSTGNYTSARLQTGAPGASTHTTDGNWQYGRITARIRLPYFKGTWPAFWALGETIGTAGWPVCGEIDIMENFGANKNNAGVNSGTAHGPGYSGSHGITKAYILPYGEKVADDFHVYAIEWSEDSIQWSVDGNVYHRVTPASVPPGARWVFNAPFFLLLNLAVGGGAAGNPDANAPFPPQDMLVDYVRVYQAMPAEPAVNPVNGRQ